MQTELRLGSGEFSRYDVTADKEITFCLKELRAVLAFQDYLALPINLYFDEPGRFVLELPKSCVPLVVKFSNRYTRIFSFSLVFLDKFHSKMEANVSF